MIDKHIVGCFKHLSVHVDPATFAVSGPNTSGGVEGFAVPHGVPFVLSKVKIVIKVHNGELALCKRYPAEAVAVSNPAIQQYRPDKYPDEPKWNVNGEPNYLAPQ